MPGHARAVEGEGDERLASTNYVSCLLPFLDGVASAIAGNAGLLNWAANADVSILGRLAVTTFD
jgi:hypothetical protein